ncbi:MAG: sugar ABC transporter permease, partial [Pseudomonadota bacterium]
MGVSLALLLEKPIRGASVFRTIFILPLMVSPVVVGLIWRYLFDADIAEIIVDPADAGIEQVAPDQADDDRGDHQR